MIASTDFTEGRLRELVEGCLRLALPIGARLPAEDEDWIARGALDSMSHVNVLLCIEKAAGLPDLFGRLEGEPPRTTQSVLAVLQTLVAERERAAPSEGRKSKTDLTGAAEIVGWGFSLGSEYIQAAAVEKAFGLSPGTIADRAGIETVVQVSEGENEVGLAIGACSAALERAQIGSGDVDWIVCSSETFWHFPSLGSLLHSQLLARDACGVLDVGGACVGFLNSLSVAKSLLAAGTASRVLVVTADVHSRHLAPGRVPGEFGGLFGDGASAFLISRSDHGDAVRPYRLGDFQFGCAGTFSSALVLSPELGGQVALQFEGEVLARAAVARLERILRDLELRTRLSLDAASSFATHQPNPRLVEILARQANLPLEKFPTVAKTCGNLGSSTCGVALAKALDEHAGKRADQRGPIFLAAVGPGMLWGGGVLF